MIVDLVADALVAVHIKEEKAILATAMKTIN